MRHTLLLTGSFLMVLAGCDSPGLTSKVKSPAKAETAAVGQTTATAAELPSKDASADKQVPAVFTPGLTVSNAIARACAIQPREGKVTPSFDYDSAALADSDREMLGEIARCLTEGALKGKNVSLIGRADARGEPEYNMTLGGSRADTVQRYLIDLGVGRPRLAATSRGEMDATGTNEAGYANDRRVDIELAQ